MLLSIQLDFKDIMNNDVHPSSRKLIIDLLLDHVILYSNDFTPADDEIPIRSLVARVIGIDIYRMLSPREKQSLDFVFTWHREHVRRAPIKSNPRPLVNDIIFLPRRPSRSSETGQCTTMPLDVLLKNKSLAQPAQHYKIERIHPDEIFCSHAIDLREGLSRDRQVFVPKDAYRDTVWDHIFKEYAGQARIITLCDRYALSSSGLSGMDYLLCRTKETNVRRLRLIAQPIYTSRTTPSTLDEKSTHSALSKLSRFLKHSGIHGEVFLGTKEAFKRFGHARHIRFDRFSWTLDSGIELFSSGQEGRVDRHHLLHRSSGPSCLRRENDLINRTLPYDCIQLPFHRHG